MFTFNQQNQEMVDNMTSSKLKKKSKLEGESTDHSGDEDMEDKGEGQHELPGERIATATAARGAESTVHTAMENLNLQPGVRTSS